MIEYDYAKHACSGKAQPGTTQLLAEILARFSGSSSSGIYNCRNIGGSNAASLHSEGRALDVRPTSINQGNQIRDWVYANRDAYQVQEIIWNRQIWSSLKPVWRPYSGSNPHTDHLHIGQNWIGATGEGDVVAETGSGNGIWWFVGTIVASVVITKIVNEAIS